MRKDIMKYNFRVCNAFCELSYISIKGNYVRMVRRNRHPLIFVLGLYNAHQIYRGNYLFHKCHYTIFTF